MNHPVARLSAALEGRYTIEREVGVGGMATVYLARDVKHNRRVALKVLKPELGIVLGPERFLSEIETTANLQHPHLLPLFDSGEVDGLLFYVMPYVEGETLRQRLERERQLPVDEAIRIAVAVASALDYAHRHGVIHRDLKPENILLHEGQPLVSDFGIALAVSNAGGTRITQTGLSLGTPQYMSPEQATGDRVIDARSDIYSLGAVLYEMLVGDPPHSAGTTQAIIAKVLTEKAPSVRAMRDTVPEYVDLAVQKSLAKLAADRFASAGEFGEALTGARRVMPATSVVSAQRDASAIPLGRRSRFAVFTMWGGWALGLVAVGVAAAVWRRPTTTAQTARFLVTLPDSFQLGRGLVLLSPDGSKLVISGRSGGSNGLFLRRLDDPVPQFIRGTEGVGGGVTVSPDGNWLLFLRARSLVKVAVTGGAPIAVVDSAGGGGESWGDRNEVVYSGLGGSLMRVSSEGGAGTLLARPDTSRGHIRYAGPIILPGGKAALITIATGTSRMAGSQLSEALGLVTIPEGKVTELGIAGFGTAYVSPGHLLYGRPDRVLMAVPFSVSGLRLTGPSVQLSEGELNMRNDVAAGAVSRNGTLALIVAPSGNKRSIVAVDRNGVARPFLEEKNEYSFPRFSPDGRRIAMSIGTSTGDDIWTYDISSRTLTRLTHDGRSARPKWSRDGSRIAYLARDSVGAVIKWQPWDGSGVAEMLVRPGAGVSEVVLDPAHGFAAFRVVGGSAAQTGTSGLPPSTPSMPYGLLWQPRSGRGTRASRLTGVSSRSPPKKPGAPKYSCDPCPDRAGASRSRQAVARSLPGRLTAGRSSFVGRGISCRRPSRSAPSSP